MNSVFRGLLNLFHVLFVVLLISCGGSGSSGLSEEEPTITSFAAVQLSVASKTGTTLTAVFTGGTGSIDPGIGAVTSGEAHSTGDLTQQTTFTLTVTNTNGKSVTETVTIVIRDIYVAGYVHEAERERYVATLWTNGVATALPAVNSDSRAFSVAVSGSDVFVAGDDGGVATVWKNNSATVLSSSAKAMSVFVDVH